MTRRFIPEDDVSSCKGFSVLELLIAAVLVLIVISYAVTTVVRGQKPALRTNAARQVVNYLQQARNDSMRRRATVTSEMAQVTILNDRYYSVTMDANGDGVLDTPLLVRLVEQHVNLGGPFPRTYMFDSHGKPVDSNGDLIKASPITVSNSSGTNMIKLSDAGQPLMDGS